MRECRVLTEEKLSHIGASLEQISRKPQNLQAAETGLSKTGSEA
jgi:hypothetical protein